MSLNDTSAPEQQKRKVYVMDSQKEGEYPPILTPEGEPEDIMVDSSTRLVILSRGRTLFAMERARQRKDSPAMLMPVSDGMVSKLIIRNKSFILRTSIQKRETPGCYKAYYHCTEEYEVGVVPSEKFVPSPSQAISECMPNHRELNATKLFGVTRLSVARRLFELYAKDIMYSIERDSVYLMGIPEALLRTLLYLLGVAPANQRSWLRGRVRPFLRKLRFFSPANILGSELKDFASNLGLDYFSLREIMESEFDIMKSNSTVLQIAGDDSVLPPESVPDLYDDTLWFSPMPWELASMWPGSSSSPSDSNFSSMPFIFPEPLPPTKAVSTASRQREEMVPPPAPRQLAKMVLSASRQPAKIVQSAPPAKTVPSPLMPSGLHGSLSRSQMVVSSDMTVSSGVTALALNDNTEMPVSSIVSSPASLSEKVNSLDDSHEDVEDSPSPLAEIIRTCSDDLESDLFAMDAVNTIGIGLDASGHDAFCVGLEEGADESVKQKIRDIVTKYHEEKKVELTFELVFKNAPKLVLGKGDNVRAGSKLSIQQQNDSQNYTFGSIGLVFGKEQSGWALTSGHVVKTDGQGEISVSIAAGSAEIRGSVVGTLLDLEKGADVALVQFLGDFHLDSRCIQISGDQFLTAIRMKTPKCGDTINKIDEIGHIKEGRVDEHACKVKVKRTESSAIYRNVLMVNTSGTGVSSNDGKPVPFSKPGDSGAGCFVSDGHSECHRAFVGIVIGSLGERAAISLVSSFSEWLRGKIDVKSLTVFYQKWASAIKQLPPVVDARETPPPLIASIAE